jgi:tetratricopeptide (TPR) repeat protein
MPLGYDQYPHLDEGVQLAKSALARDSHLSRAHMVLGWYAFVREHDFRKAKDHFEKAILDDPNDWETHEWYGMVLSMIGEHAKAIAQMEAATGLGGSEPDVNVFYGKALFAARRYADAAEKYRKAITISKAEKGFFHWQLAKALLWQDPTSDSTIEKWVDATYGAEESWVVELKQSLRQGRKAFWSKRLESVRQRSDDPLILADAAAMSGETAAALDYLEKAQIQKHDFLVQRLKNDPEWDSLRGEPRFKKLLTALNLSE